MRSGSLQDDRLVVADESGAVLATARSDGVNPQHNPEDEPRENVHERSLGPSTTSQPSGTRWRRQTARTDSSTRH
jgi:hypothetical protein